MFNTPEFIVLGALIILLLCIIIILFISVRSLKKQVRLTATSIASNELLVNQLQTLFLQIDKSLAETNTQHSVQNTELNQVSKQLEHRIKNLQDDILKLQQVQSQQPEDKLYSRALKLVELGADAEELVRECDIPKAEADILIAIHQKKNPL
ncbi:DUF2802 domain-containing protein [Pseudocolwellia agarivorans]|uniref:DUF2802 domain-containing protein n=1 Tax=Pseudocolwellia agarivorans TaxID=1911682 RepID=UPI0009844113|nr:DUF2802 domain-containing protein [Pseudocolwellia agarivorans]